MNDANIKYILRGKRVVKAKNLKEWAEFFQDGTNRVVKQETLTNGYYISTVFLHGINHRFGKGRPLFFETMAFGKNGDADLDMERYTTWKEAEAGHERMVKKYE